MIVRYSIMNIIHYNALENIDKMLNTFEIRKIY